ncbi:MAG: hypothetical protein RL729_305 [Actinomycetota bacterium]|jgi:hypothetical protein
MEKRMTKKVSKFLTLSILAIFTAGCSWGAGDDTAGASDTIPVIEENPYGASDIESPSSDEVILTVRANGKQFTFSLNQLSELPVTDLNIFEPFIKQNSQFTGVEMSEIFNVTSISGSDITTTIALNEYTYSNTAEKFSGSNALIAYAQNGKPIPMDRGGPIRIIYPDSSLLAKVLDAWNWSISEIIVE